jgi:hypothetical protein
MPSELKVDPAQVAASVIGCPDEYVDGSSIKDWAPSSKNDPDEVVADIRVPDPQVVGPLRSVYSASPTFEGPKPKVVADGFIPGGNAPATPGDPDSMSEPVPAAVTPVWFCVISMIMSARTFAGLARHAKVMARRATVVFAVAWFMIEARGIVAHFKVLYPGCCPAELGVYDARCVGEGRGPLDLAFTLVVTHKFLNAWAI